MCALNNYLVYIDTQRHTHTNDTYNLIAWWQGIPHQEVQNGLNAGVFLVRNVPYSYEMLREIWNTPSQYWNPWHEQSAFHHMLHNSNPRHEYHLSHFHFPPQRRMNSYPFEAAFGVVDALYVEGDFIARFGNCRHSQVHCALLFHQFYVRSHNLCACTDNAWNDVPSRIVIRSSWGHASTLPSQTPFSVTLPHHEGPRIAVVTLNANPSRTTVSNEEGPILDASWQHPMSYRNKLCYCMKWGYDLIIEDDRIVDQTRLAVWSKVLLVEQWLPKYDWVMWMDMDLLVMNMGII